MNDTARALAQRLIRNLDDVPKAREVREPLYDSTGARLAPGTAARRLGASVDILAPGRRACPYHLHHAQEEMFVVLEGSGTLRVAGEMLPLRQGDVVFVPPGPQYPHQIVNTSDAPLKILSISTQDLPEVCEYPDSGKFMVRTGAAAGAGAALLAIRDRGPGIDDVDYWAGEP
ncbi:MAG: cupin domain-containing protein [Rubrivivax sp.]|nr:cupin domain-containing protein [Rubrivivax sp.]MCA3256599.1 cupin domain-containing protein [Rubrivivax sp.]MCZ8032995.1 cupin domain-containing protein [Rubrivivax sp.]